MVLEYLVTKIKKKFYFQTATSIGKNKKPHVDNVYEILFMTVSWLMGFFVVSILIGDIRDIVGNARRSALTYQVSAVVIR